MNRKRARIVIEGAVQGVGFRPFVYHLAHELHLGGWVSNCTRGVLIEAEGAENSLHEFTARLEKERPQLAEIRRFDCADIEPVAEEDFEIHSSNSAGSKTALILPDLVTCQDCLRDLFDITNRRYLYPFTNCTHCGPRFSIIEALPYDRASTSMKSFVMCADCVAEYHDPANRRFHAQPNACPKCGPHVELWDPSGHCLCSERDALLEAATAVRVGQIVAIKGIGGFQLIADARNEGAVQRLRLRKRREEKPFAVMFPSVEMTERCCRVTPEERNLLLSTAAPIVLLSNLPKGNLRIAASVAPKNPFLGVMLPYSPLHQVLLHILEFPIVATSGNASDEPICTDESEALERLRGIADIFLVHNRPIVRHVDDSVARVMLGRETVLRRARGYAPMPIQTAALDSEPILAVGAHLKNAMALGFRDQVFVSQHIGDLETALAAHAFRKACADLPKLYEATPQIIAHDLHPEYFSTRFAEQFEAPCSATESAPRLVGVQHHYAHVLSCMADNELTGPALGVSWDGTGFGLDETIWGGEFLKMNETSFDRFAHFRQFTLPGGEAAIKQPRRCALGLLFEIYGEDLFARNHLPLLREFTSSELRMLKRMLTEGLNSPVTSSAGRFFDAIASLVGLRQRSSFEGQAAMELEFASAPGVAGSYPFELWKTKPIVFDWQPTAGAVLKDCASNKPINIIAAKLHNTLAELIIAVAKLSDQQNIVLSGGCFQSKYLTEATVTRLREEGFTPYWHRRVPPNDGGIALGQVLAAKRQTTHLEFQVPTSPRAESNDFDADVTLVTNH